MPYNGSGVFLINTAGQPVVTATVISSTAFNALTADLGTGLSTALTKDGQSTPTANLTLGGFKLTSVGLATATGDALSYGRAATITALTITGFSGLLTAAAGVVSASSTLTTTLTFDGSTTVPALVVRNIVEPETVSATAATGTIALYPSSQSILYYTTNSSANFVLNATWSAGTTMDTALATGQAVTVVFKNTNGATPHYCTAVQVDGATVGVTTKWQAAAPAAGNANAIDAYTLTVTKTGTATFSVLASLTPFT